MTIDNAQYIGALDTTIPANGDLKAEWPQNARNLKTALKQSFPAVTGAVGASHTELNILDGATVTTAELNILDGVTATAAEINVLDGLTPTTTELNFVDGVTSAIQTQLNAKAPLASPALTGVPTAPTASVGTNTTQIATMAAIQAQVLAASLPNESAGTLGQGLISGGSPGSAAWSDVVTPTNTKTLTNKTLTAPVIATIVSGAGTNTLPTTTGTLLSTAAAVSVPQGGTGVATFTDGGVLVGNGTGNVQATSAGILGQVLTSGGPGVDPTFQTVASSALVLLSAVSAVAATTVDIETTFDSTYDAYLLVISGLTLSGGNTLLARLKIGGAYITTSTYGWLREETTGSSYGGFTGSSQTEITVYDSATTNTANPINLEFRINNPTSTVQVKSVAWNGRATRASPTAVRISGAGFNSGTAALTGIRFYQSSGDMTGGFNLYGYKKI